MQSTIRLAAVACALTAILTADHSVRATTAASAPDADVVQLAKGMLPVKIDAVDPIRVEADREFVIEGIVEAADPVIVVFRADDLASSSYSDRYNGERSLPPGPFRWTVAAKALRTSHGRPLDHTALRRIILFHGRGSGRVTITRFEIAKPPSLPAGAKGYAFGNDTAEVPAGFERIAPGDPRVEGRSLTAVRRPAPDPLTASGIRGIGRVRLPWNGGPARITLWTEDVGEWERLPPALQRRIRVNGRDVLLEKMSPDEWIRGRYMRGAGIEHNLADDAWTAFGRWRGGKVQAVVDPVEDAFVIELAGAGPEATYLSAILIEPANTTAASDAVEAQRRAWYEMHWPVAARTPARQPAHTVVLGPASGREAPIEVTAARGTGARLSLDVTSNVTVDQPLVSITPPAGAGSALPTTVWAGKYRLDRRAANDTLLVRDDRTLTDPSALPLPAATTRRYEVWIEVPETAPPGSYTGRIEIRGTAEEMGATVPITVSVLSTILPPASKPAGFYLDESPHLRWFPGGSSNRDRQAACDLAFLARFGLSGSAPPLATPAAERGAFEADMERAARGGLTAPWLGYTPAKRLLSAHGLEKSAAIIASREADLRQDGLPPPLWSIADEPSNPGTAGGELTKWIAAIRAAAPSARLAAQLNAPTDRALAHLFDTAIVNDGFGLDIANLTATASTGTTVWLYNTDAPRLTAGLWLWSSPAERYLQWHARMPTADPFDPTDGREGDVQVLLPSADVCPERQDIDRSLLEMADGLIDQRWLAWLARQTSPEAIRLMEDIRSRTPRRWGEAVRIPASDLQSIRESIIRLAR